MGFVLLIILAVAAGCGLSVQAGINGRLGSESGSPIWATMASFAIGLLLLLPLTFLPRNHWPAIGQFTSIRWWVWTGGLIGAAYVLSTIVLAPRLGAAVFFAIVVAGQIAMSLLLDHYGWLGFSRHPINAMRLAGGALIIAGVFFVRRF